MTDGARVSAVEAMHEARAALAEFAETVARTLAGVDAEVYRTDDWLSRERPAHWKREVRIREDAVHEAKSLVARKVILAGPDPARAVEERALLKRAQRRLEEGKRRSEATRRWALVCAKQAMDCKAGCAELRTMATATIPEGIARIGRMMEAVESYLSIAPPRAAPLDSGGEHASGHSISGEPGK